MNTRMQTSQPEQGVCERRGHFGELSQFTHRRDQCVNLHRFTSPHVLQHGRGEGAQFAGNHVAIFRVLGNGNANLPPISRASSMTALTKPRTSSSSMMRSAVAPVKALMGFTVILPQSLNQMSFWICAETVASKPACLKSSASASTRELSPPAGSPTIKPLPK